MNRKRIAATVIYLCALLLPSSAVVAQGLVPCSIPDNVTQASCTICAGVTLIQNIINAAIGVAFPLSAILFAYAGFLYMTSGVSAGQISKAHGIFKSVAIGFVAVLCGWLVVDTLIHTVVLNSNSGYFNSVGGTWYSLPSCSGLQRPTSSTIPQWLFGSFGSGASGPSAVSVNPAPPASGTGTSVENNIAGAAPAYDGASTAAGPGNGALACAWAVNNVLANAGVAPIDADSVQSMENALQGGRGTLTSQASAQPGDIVIQGNDAHVGICQNAGCTSVISNSSSNASFTYVSDVNFSSSYPNGPPSRIYRVTN